MTLADNAFGLDERGSEAIFKLHILIVFNSVVVKEIMKITWK